MLETIREFILLTDPNVRLVVLGSVMLGAGAALVGCFTFLRRRALVGDAIAHAVLPGVCLAFIVSGNKNPFVLLVGAIIAGWISLLFMDFIVNRTKLKEDSAIGIVLSVFFGFGILLLTAIQHQGAGNQSGLDKFLFGKAASMTSQDVKTILVVSTGIIGVTALFFKEFKLLSFDPSFARSAGLPVRGLEFVLSTITVLAIAIGIQAVGVVLMAALLITPAAAARFWTHHLVKMLALAMAFGILSAWFGSLVSYARPAMPTGPWIVIFLSGLAMISIFFAPKRGIIARFWNQRIYARKILMENILKTFYNLGENDNQFQTVRSLTTLNASREFLSRELKRGIHMLKKEGWVKSTGEGWKLSDKGLVESRRIVRLHRLWELYLNQRLRLAPDHVHHDAESIEHLITPEVEKQLEKELGFPSLDPHKSSIPY